MTDEIMVLRSTNIPPPGARWCPRCGVRMVSEGYTLCENCAQQEPDSFDPERAWLDLKYQAFGEGGLMEQRDAARAENRRLRAALELIADCDCADCADAATVAREAPGRDKDG